jgi:Lrp/AsnC family leucine-responsive transcriptional regulator
MPSRHAILLDQRNLELIQLLQNNPRMPITELARHIGMSSPAVRERLTRLEETGVIRGFRLDLDPKLLGFPVTLIVRVRPMPGQLTKIAELARLVPEVAECHRITGEDCFIMKIYLDDLANLDRVLDRFLVFGQTTTSVVQSSPVPSRAPPLLNATGVALDTRTSKSTRAKGRAIKQPYRRARSAEQKK